jgi:hypothetical protein
VHRARTDPAARDHAAVTPLDLARLRRARDLMDRDYARPLDVPALARTALTTRRIERDKAPLRVAT